MRAVAASLLAALVAMTAACGQDEEELDTIRLQLKGEARSQFMGFYVALAEGYYEREGLQVEILPATPGLSPLETLADGLADVAVDWLPVALSARGRGLPMVNVAQLFQHSGLVLICHKDRGIVAPENLRGRRVAVAGAGDQIPLLNWMASLGVSTDGGPDGLTLVPLRDNLALYTTGEVDCIQAMSYHAYWQLLLAGSRIGDMSIFRYENFDFDLLEDGLYVDERRLDDPAFRDALVRFVRASLAGWKRALRQPLHAALVVTHMAPETSMELQSHMAEEVAKLVGDPATLGLLDLRTFDHTVAQIAAIKGEHVSALTGSPWTHAIWEEATGQGGGLFSRETLYRLDQILASPWFYVLDLVGTVAFAIAGFMRARERLYDLWGAFMLTLLPAVGGGTLRDVLVGGTRHPPFIFNDPIYIYIVIAVVVFGSLASYFAIFPRAIRQQFGRILLITDTIGLAAFTVIGAKVAIVAGLDWFWIPVCAALTCAGGGMLLDVVTGREPRTFKGEPYEEMAIVGGLLLIVLLALADWVPFVTDYLVASIVVVLVFVFCLRMAAVKSGYRTPLLGAHRRLRGFREPAAPKPVPAA